MRADELMESGTGFQLFVDMDGVLVAFNRGAAKLVGDPQFDLFNKRHRNILWARMTQIDPSEAENFWAGLDWTDDGKILWNYVSKFNPIILSSPGTTLRSVIEAGKDKWIRQNLHPSPSKVIFDTDKWKHAEKFNILIDDSAKQLIPWEEHGGIAIHHVEGDAKSTIKQLQKRFGFPKR